MSKDRDSNKIHYCMWQNILQGATWMPGIKPGVSNSLSYHRATFQIAIEGQSKAAVIRSHLWRGFWYLAKFVALHPPINKPWMFNHPKFNYMLCSSQMGSKLWTWATYWKSSKFQCSHYQSCPLNPSPINPYTPQPCTPGISVMSRYIKKSWSFTEGIEII